MLDPTELQHVAETFGVDESQVLRDHLISHLLAAITADAADDVMFFGGTALARSLIPDGRLSEDIDLIATGSRRQLAERLSTVLPLALRREFPGLTWQPPLTGTTESAPAVIRTTDGLSVRIQLLGETGYPQWPTTTVDLVQRYSDAPPARLTVPTPAGFAAAKATAWRDRRASRDLWDLWALARRGHLDHQAANLYARLGPTNHRPDPRDYTNPPDQSRWERDLGAQTTLAITADEAATHVGAAWHALTTAQHHDPDRRAAARGMDRGMNRRIRQGTRDRKDIKEAQVDHHSTTERTGLTGLLKRVEVRILPGAPCLTCTDYSLPSRLWRIRRARGM